MEKRDGQCKFVTQSLSILEPYSYWVPIIHLAARFCTIYIAIAIAIVKISDVTARTIEYLIYLQYAWLLANEIILIKGIH